MNAPRSTPGPSHPVDGLLLVDKPRGPTSHDIVAMMRRHFGMKKVGHGGTLDPMATGLLVILLGRGTKLSNFVMGTDKTYEGTFHLGVSTSTQDGEGGIVGEADPSGIPEHRIREEMAKRTGDLMQTPPMVSAVKKDGVPLYKLARKGKTVARDPRLIHVYAFDLLACRIPFAEVRIVCSKGTYVRTLCAEVGDALGCGAHLSALQRTRSGQFDVADAVSLEQALAMPPQELARRVLSPHQVQAAQWGIK